jgi:glucose uptake protein GlcU
MILFETSTSVFELLWDIALALFIIRLAFFYFILSFATGCFIAFFRVSQLQHIQLLTQPQSELVTLPIWLIFFTLWARFIVINYEVPRVGGFRLAIGAVALVFMLIAELLGGIFMYEQGYSDWVWETDPLAASLGAVTLLLFGLMPTLLMVFEAETDELGETSHGHENKPIIAAVYVFSYPIWRVC